jgi:plastocyanin
MEAHAANGMMALIAYDGAVPTGPVAAYFDPDGGVAPAGGGHRHGPPATAPAPAPVAADAPAAPTATPAPAEAAAGGPTGGVVEVAMLDDRFDLPELTVAAGTILRFVNRGANWHSVAAFDGSFDSGRVDPGGSFEVRLGTPGEYRFICQHHGLRGMVGRVTVT